MSNFTARTVLAGGLVSNGPGARLTKTWGVITVRYITFTTPGKMHILCCLGSNFFMNFQRAPFKFHTKFWTHKSQNMRFIDFNFFVIYDILELWRHKP